MNTTSSVVSGKTASNLSGQSKVTVLLEERSNRLDYRFAPRVRIKDLALYGRMKEIIDFKEVSLDV